MSYRYRIYKVPIFLKNDKIVEYIESLCRLYTTCTRINMTYDMYVNFLKMNMDGRILLASDDHQIVGTVFVRGEPIVRLTDHKDSPRIQPYVLQRPFPDNRNFFEQSTYYLFPMICNFCRHPDNQYKGVGRTMLQQIIDWCRKDGYRSIYCVPESITELSDPTRQDGTCGMNREYDDQNTKYYTENMRLIGYYKKMGFDILDNHYAVDLCSDGSGDSDYMAFHVLYINL